VEPLETNLANLSAVTAPVEEVLPEAVAVQTAARVAAVAVAVLVIPVVLVVVLVSRQVAIDTIQVGRV